MNLPIEVNKVSLRFKSHYALQDVSFELENNRIYGLLGRNGAGKTTLLSLLASFREPTSGTISIGGENPFENAAKMQQVNFIFNKDFKEESDHLLDMIDNISRYRPNFDREYANHLIQRFNLPATRPLKQLSKGMQAAVNVTLGLASRTPITIFDEVYNGMDAPTREIFYEELLNDHSEHPRMMILSTHLVSEMDYLFEEVLILDKGKLVLQEDYETLVAKGAAITGDVEIVNDFVQSMTQLSTKQLGNTKSVMVYGQLSEAERLQARARGLEVGNISLQELFIHLTEGEE